MGYYAVINKNEEALCTNMEGILRYSGCVETIRVQHRKPQMLSFGKK